MTIIRRDGQFQTEFGQWIQSVPELDSVNFAMSVSDCDFWCHRYSVPDRKRPNRNFDHVMLLEVKMFSRRPDFAQRDTLQVVDELLRSPLVNGRRRAKKIRDTRSPMMEKTRFVRCFGVHYLTLSGSSPLTSDRMFWDQKYQITVESLIRLIKFDLDPDHPTKKLDTGIHHVVRPKQLSLLALAKKMGT